jgi:hypothetical protein
MRKERELPQNFAGVDESGAAAEPESITRSIMARSPAK